MKAHCSTHRRTVKDIEATCSCDAMQASYATACAGVVMETAGQTEKNMKAAVAAGSTMTTANIEKKLKSAVKDLDRRQGEEIERAVALSALFAAHGHIIPAEVLNAIVAIHGRAAVLSFSLFFGLSGWACLVTNSGSFLSCLSRIPPVSIIGALKSLVPSPPHEGQLVFVSRSLIVLHTS